MTRYFLFSYSYQTKTVTGTGSIPVIGGFPSRDTLREYATAQNPDCEYIGFCTLGWTEFKSRADYDAFIEG